MATNHCYGIIQNLYTFKRAQHGHAFNMGTYLGHAFVLFTVAASLLIVRAQTRTYWWRH